MADVLARIVARKRVEIAARLNGPVAAEPTRRSLRAALARPGARFVMEVKRASPSGHRAAVSLEQAVAAYAPVADAISVLTDGPDFGGSLDDLRTVRGRFDGPILAKDFIVDPAQVSEARSAGADGVLAMLSVLDDSTAARVLAEAKRLAMDAIVEVHDEAEMGRAIALGAAVIGINNRDLKTLTTDLSVTERLAGRVPAGVLAISESGIMNHADVERLASQVDAFLVGSALMAAPDIAEAARALVHGRVKICGLTNADDVALAARHGATHAGLIVIPGTPRAIEAGEAATLAQAARQAGMKAVGVFRNAPIDQVAAAAKVLDVVQLHGVEDADYVAGLRARTGGQVEIWGLCGAGDDALPPRPGVDRSLFDHAAKPARGRIRWSALDGRADLADGFLAGGITPADAAAAHKVGAYGIDLCSGVESRPRRKDPAKVAALFDALRPRCRGEA